MNIKFSSISFKQSNKSDYKSTIDPVDKRFEPIVTQNGIVYPTSYDDCYEKMTFENDDDSVDIWRDSEYVDYDNTSVSDHFAEDYIRMPYDYPRPNYKYYSHDDVDLSDSLVRKDCGFFESPTNAGNFDLPDSVVNKLNFINFIENIVPSSINCKPEPEFSLVNQLASISNEFYSTGFSKNDIIVALGKCVLDNPQNGTRTADSALFEFLLIHPNLRKFVVVNDNNNVEKFDVNYADYYSNFRQHCFNSEKDVKMALELCRINKSGFNLVDRNLCKLVMLLRNKSAQGIEASSKPEYNNFGVKINNADKFCDKNMPLSEKDIKLIEYIKSDLLTFDIKLNDALFLMKKQGKTVDEVFAYFENSAKVSKDSDSTIIDKPNEKIYKTSENEKTNIEKIEYNDKDGKININKKNTEIIANNNKLRFLDNMNMDHINKILDLRNKLLIKYSSKSQKDILNIEAILYDELSTFSNKTNLNPNAFICYELVDSLKDTDMSVSAILAVLKRISTLSKTINIDIDSAQKYVQVLSYRMINGQLGIDRTLNRLMEQLCQSSNKVSDVELDLIKKIDNLRKEKGGFYIGNFVVEMINKQIPNEKILTNFDEVTNYMRRMFSIRSKLGITYYLKLMQELYRTAANESFSCETSPLLQKYEKELASKKVLV